MKNLHRLVFVLTATLMAGAALAQGNERQISGIDISEILVQRGRQWRRRHADTSRVWRNAAE